MRYIITVGFQVVFDAPALVWSRRFIPFLQNLGRQSRQRSFQLQPTGPERGESRGKFAAAEGKMKPVLSFDCSVVSLAFLV